MLSDGAGAIVRNKPRKTISLKIKWIEIKSFANQLETCMYAGAEKTKMALRKDGKNHQPNSFVNQYSLKRDVRVLGKEIVRLEPNT